MRYLLIAAMVALPFAAHAQTTQGTLAIKDGTGASQTIPADKNGSNTTPHTVLEIAGAPNSSSNPIFIGGSVSGSLTALGAVTTAPPAYTAGTSQPPSLTTFGATRVSPMTIQSTPTGGNTTLTTTAATTIPASASYNRTGYQVEGTGYGCASWVTASVTISGTTANATCGGAGAFLITNGAYETRQGVVPTTALTAVAASGATLVLVWEVQ